MSAVLASIPMRAVVALVLGTALLWSSRDAAQAQSAQAVLQGQVRGESGAPLSAALVLLRNAATGAQAYRFTNAQGFYYLPALPPGTYAVRADARGFQPEERSPVELPVAGRVELNFSLRPTAPTATPPPAPPRSLPARAIPRNILAIMYGADAAVPQAVMVELPVSFTETLSGTLSSLIDETRIRELPLAGRDVYTLLVLQPGVTSDNAAGRGLGFAVHGQRAGSSHFLLDGADNNDLLVTGPATRISAEAVQEYRLNTSNFTAEFGRASGFIANVITRSGSGAWRGTLFEYFNHDRFNANAFNYNWQHVSRPPFRQNQYGGTVGGPLRRERLFVFGNFEQWRTSSRSQPLWTILPSAALLELIAPFGDAIPANHVFRRFPPPPGAPIPDSPLLASQEFVFPVVETDTFALGRMDLTPPDASRRLSGRYAVSQQTLENFFFTLYPGLNAPLRVRGQNLALNFTQEIAGGTSESRFGYNRSSIGAERAHPDLPAIYSLDGVLYPWVVAQPPSATSGGAILLPGMDNYAENRFRGASFNVVENYSRLAGRHALGAGMDWRLSFSDSLFPIWRSGVYYFASGVDFFLPGQPPAYLTIPLNRLTGRPGTDADFWGYHRQSEWAVFFQDHWKPTPRLTLNLGLRYEYFGAPAARRTTRNWNFVFGGGSSVEQRIASGSIEPGGLYRSDGSNFAPRFGFAFDLFGTGRGVLRGGYGLFFDRVLNNTWLNTVNNSLPVQFLVRGEFAFSIPVEQGLATISPERIENTSTVAFDRQLRSPYVQSWFLGWQQELAADLLLEVNHVGSVGRKLLTSDFVNRAGSLPRTAANPHGRFNPRFSQIVYYGNQGNSDHLGLEVGLNKRWRRGLAFQLSYTLARSRDAQSDPLVLPQTGSSGNFNPFTRRLAVSTLGWVPVFTRQFDPSSNFGKSDFDQTQNLMLNVVAQLPAVPRLGPLLRGWQIAGLIGIRSGLPFTVFTNPAAAAGEEVVSQRADFIGTRLDDAFLERRAAVQGGVVLLNRDRFRVPANGLFGRLPRNALRGPGFWNADLSVSRSFPLRGMSETAGVQLRMDLFNLFNHANLNNPDAQLESPAFGTALYGRQGAGSALPSVSTLNEQPRRIQLAVKAYF